MKPALKKSTIEMNGLQIELIQKKMKSVSIRVCPPLGEIRVSAPLHYSRDRVLSALASRVEWMTKHQKKYQQIHAAALDRQMSTPVLYYLGKPFNYEFKEHKSERGVKMAEANLVVSIRPGSSSQQQTRTIKLWQHEELQRELNFLIEKWSAVLEVKVSSFSIRQMKSKWGACHINERKIVFNLELIKHSPACIEYVVAHELIHLIEPSHNSRFKRYMSACIPGWKIYKQDLDRNHLLMSHS